MVRYYANHLWKTVQVSAKLNGVAVGALPILKRIVAEYRHYKIAGMACACFEWVVQLLVKHGATGNFSHCLEACMQRLGGDLIAESMAKYMIKELNKEAESTL